MLIKCSFDFIIFYLYAFYFANRQRKFIPINKHSRNFYKANFDNAQGCCKVRKKDLLPAKGREKRRKKEFFLGFCFIFAPFRVFRGQFFFNKTTSAERAEMISLF